MNAQEACARSLEDYAHGAISLEVRAKDHAAVGAEVDGVGRSAPDRLSGEHAGLVQEAACTTRDGEGRRAEVVFVALDDSEVGAWSAHQAEGVVTPYGGPVDDDGVASQDGPSGGVDFARIGPAPGKDEGVIPAAPDDIYLNRSVKEAGEVGEELVSIQALINVSNFPQLP